MSSYFSSTNSTSASFNYRITDEVYAPRLKIRAFREDEESYKESLARRIAERKEKMRKHQEMMEKRKEPVHFDLLELDVENIQEMLS